MLGHSLYLYLFRSSFQIVCKRFTRLMTGLPPLLFWPGSQKTKFLLLSDLENLWTSKLLKHFWLNFLCACSSKMTYGSGHKSHYYNTFIFLCNSERTRQEKSLDVKSLCGSKTRWLMWQHTYYKWNVVSSLTNKAVLQNLVVHRWE